MIVVPISRFVSLFTLDIQSDQTKQNPKSGSSVVTDQASAIDDCKLYSVERHFEIFLEKCFRINHLNECFHFLFHIAILTASDNRIISRKQKRYFATIGEEKIFEKRLLINNQYGIDRFLPIWSQ